MDSKENTPEKITPKNKRARKSLVSSLMDSPNTSDILKNDDATEKRKRHELKIVELSKNFGSNLSANSTMDVSIDQKLVNMSETQLSDLYSKSLQLAADNKINISNAFMLPIIDLFSKKIKDPNYVDNFQITSRSLDASAKVYSCRVDIVHAETFRIAGELSMGSKKRKQDGKPSEEDQLDDDNLNNGKKKKKSKQKKPGQNIAPEPSNLNRVALIEEECRVAMDPFFQSNSQIFSEEGINGLLVKNMMEDGSTLIHLDSRTVVKITQPTPKAQIDLPLRLPNNIVDIPSYYILDFDFEDLKVTSFDMVRADYVATEGEQEPPIKKLCLSELMENSPEVEDDIGEGAAGGDDGNDAIFDAPSHMEDTIQEGQEGVGNDDDIHLENVNDCEDNHIAQMLLSERTEYSYLNPDALANWAGPSFWKHNINKLGGKNRHEPEETARKKATKKKFQILEFDEENIDQYFVRTKNNYELNHETMKLWNSKRLTHPKDDHLKLDFLIQHYQKPNLPIRKSIPYPYNDHNDDTDDDEMFEDDNSLRGFEVCENNDVSDEEQAASFFEAPTNAAPPQPFLFTQETNNVLSQDIFGDTNKKPVLHYERKSKRVDVRNLKEGMWKVLAPPTKDDPKPKKMPGEFTFTQMYKELPKHLSELNAQNLSIPLAYVCFLHMVNEKVLHLEMKEDRSDFKISQG